MTWNDSHIFSQTRLKKRRSPTDPLTQDEEAYIISSWKKALRDGTWQSRGQSDTSIPSVSSQKLARDLCTSHQTVMRVVHSAERVEVPIETRGRPRTFTDEHIQILWRIIGKNLFRNPEFVAALFASATGLPISVSSVKRLAGPYRRCLTCPKPVLKAKHRIQRYLFCQWISSNPRAIIERLADTDECYIDFNMNDGSWVWAADGEEEARYCPTKKQHFKKLLIWGGFSLAYGATELFLLEKGTIDGLTYRKVLSSFYLPWMEKVRAAGGNPVLRQDNASAHKTMSTIAWLEEKTVPYLPDFPAYSPDLTVSIEKIFGIMKNIIKSRGLLSDFETFKNVVRMAWGEATKKEMSAFYKKQFLHNVACCLEHLGGNEFGESGLKRIYTSDS